MGNRGVPSGRRRGPLHPPGLHNPSPAGAERTHGHYLRDPAPFRSDSQVSSRGSQLLPPRNLLGFSPTPPPRSKCPFLQSFLEIAPCLHCHEFPQAAWREQKAAQEGSSCEQGENGEGGRGSEKKNKIIITIIIIKEIKPMQWWGDSPARVFCSASEGAGGWLQITARPIQFCIRRRDREPEREVNTPKGSYLHRKFPRARRKSATKQT